MFEFLTAPSGNKKLWKAFLLHKILNFGLHLAPYELSGVNLCLNASKACIYLCINWAGRGGIFKKGESTNTIQRARMRKSLVYINQRKRFFETLAKDILKAIKLGTKHGMKVMFRLNMTSDLRDVTLKMAKLFPNHTFYEYTKHPITKNLKRLMDKMGNVHYTFSWSGENGQRCQDAINLGVNVAVPVDIKKGESMPRYYQGRPAVDGDKTDLRPCDPVGIDGKGIYVLLRAKGRAKKDRSGFVIRGLSKWRRQIVHGPQTLTSWERSA